jgi:hypothetical protein
MPAAWEEFVPEELAPALAQSAWAAADILGLASDLAVKLPGTAAAFRSGVLHENKARIIAAATQLLDPGEARAAEALVLDRAGTLTPGGLRAAIARAVMQVAPDKARKRREEAAKDARVERWTEDSGNAALVGRELPPAEVLAADQRVTWWARQLRKAGLVGSMDLRARAYLDLLLGMDSRPSPQPAGNAPIGDGPEDSGPDGDGTDGPGGGGSGPGQPAGPAPTGPAAGVIPPGFAGRLNLTVPLATVLGLADRPGEAAGIGPVDPWLARDLAAAAARNPKTTWCLTVTDQHGRPIGHGCARPAPAATPATPATPARQARPGARAGPGPPQAASPEPGFTIGREHGPPGGYGTWRLATGIPGQPDLIVTVEPVGTGTWPRSGTPPAPARPAGGPPPTPTSSTTRRTKRAAAPACATGIRSAAATTGSSNTPAGRSTSYPTDPSCGPPPPAASTPKNPPDTRSRPMTGYLGLVTVSVD